MAFHHFHKHQRTYLIAATIAMVFSLFTFSITSAIQNYVGEEGEGANPVWVKFNTAPHAVIDSEGRPTDKTTPGREVALHRDDWFQLSQEMSSFVRAVPTFYSFTLSSPDDVSHIPLIHSILLAEAEEMGIVVTPETVDAWFNANLVDRLPPGSTKGDLKNLLQNFGFSERTLKHRIGEYLKTFIYRQTVAGVDVFRPSDVQRHFQHDNEMITLDYVEFPFAEFEDAVADLQPESDDVLKTFYDELDFTTKNADFYTDESFSVDVAYVDVESFDLDAHADKLEDFVGLKDVEFVSDYNRDRTRYGDGSGDPVENVSEISDEAKSRIEREAKIDHVLVKARREYEARAAEIVEAHTPKEEESSDDSGDGAEGEGGEGDGSTDGASEDGEDVPGGGLRSQDDGTQDDGTQDDGTRDDGASDDESEGDDEGAFDPWPLIDADQKIAFEQIFGALGLTVERHEGLSRDALNELERPDHEQVHLLVQMVRGEVQLSMPGGDRKDAYLVRTIERQNRRLKQLDEAREDLLPLWRKEQAGEKARERARAFRDGIRDAAVANADPTVLQALQAAHEAERKTIEDDDTLTDAARESRLQGIDEEYFAHIGCLVGATEGGEFVRAADESGLARTSIGPFRRSAGREPFFSDRFEGAERFLKGEDDAFRFGGMPKLLRFAEGCVSNVLEDPRAEDGVLYVARVVKREVPNPAQMTMKDRLEAEQACQSDFGLARRIPYMDPFSVSTMLEAYAPMVRASQRDEEEEDAATN